MFVFAKLAMSCIVAVLLHSQVVVALPKGDVAGVTPLSGAQQFNVDNTSMAAITFGGCDPTQEEKINEAIRVAQGLIDDAHGYMNQYPMGAVIRPDDANLDRFKTWFGRYTLDDWQDMRTRFNAMKNNVELNLNSLTYNCNALANCGTIGQFVIQAWVNGQQRGVKTINLCLPFFFATSPIQRAHTIVHELAHFSLAVLPGANADTWEFYTSVLAWGLARASPDRALKNADNIAWFTRHPDMCGLSKCTIV